MDSGYSENRILEIEQMLGEAYGRPTTPGKWPLYIDNLPMSPDSLIRITGIGYQLQKAILDSREATEALCDLIKNSSATVLEVQFPKQPQYISEKLYSPVKFYLRDEESVAEGIYDDVNYWRDELSHEEAFAYINDIEAALSRDSENYDTERGLAEYIPNSLHDIIVSLWPAIEIHEDKLLCVADIKASRAISPDEMGELGQWWSGQLSDGWGEGLEQCAIKVGNSELYIELWDSSDGFFIDTQKEFDWRMGIDNPLIEKDFLASEYPLIQVKTDQGITLEKQGHLNETEFIQLMNKLFPNGNERAMDKWIIYANELDKDETEPKAKFYTDLYIELSLVKENYGDDIALTLFNSSEMSCLNAFEVRGAANLLEDGKSIFYVLDQAIAKGCDSSLEKYSQYNQKLETFLNKRSTGKNSDKKRAKHEAVNKNGNSVLAKLRDASNKPKEPQKDKNLNKVHKRNYPEI